MPSRQNTVKEIGEATDHLHAPTPPGNPAAGSGHKTGSPAAGSLPPYSPTFVFEGAEALVNAILNLCEDINALRQDVADLRSDLRSVGEQNQRQDREIWGIDGLSRLEATRAAIASHSLQIKGLWATLTLLLGTVSAVLAYRLR